ncbi:junctional adhesion molecule A isoform X2 [Hippoglossus stenolepis]|uniref:junctional adhesion molecule A isoform X2 n=1 Tax=Hippoglossus stenolepis TaxID=195615 RepID=UPI00159CC23E|nr:junctional adhesion molecule A isoform X2 [Hippoglossus stenolepis]
MKLLLSSLLLGSLCAISSRSASSTDIVTQTPDVSVMEGDALNITCCFTSMSERARFNWRKHLTENWNQSSVINKWPQGSQMNHSCSTLTFSNITREDSGKYICNVTVEIPLYSMKEGNGTVITVKPRGSAAQAVRVIYEVPHIDSEEADMDKHSTSSSRGSSQWCQVPVYESFDYFERVKNKESG